MKPQLEMKIRRGNNLGLPTSGLAFKASSNFFKSSGGDILSTSAPSIEIGTLTAENNAHC